MNFKWQLSINSWREILEDNEIILNHFQSSALSFSKREKKLLHSFFVIKIIRKALQELFSQYCWSFELTASAILLIWSFWISLLYSCSYYFYNMFLYRSVCAIVVIWNLSLYWILFCIEFPSLVILWVQGVLYYCDPIEGFN